MFGVKKKNATFTDTLRTIAGKKKTSGREERKKKPTNTTTTTTPRYPDREQLRGVAARNTWHAYTSRGAFRIYFLCF